MKDGFIRVAAATVGISLGNVEYNVERCIALTERADKSSARILLFPELCFSGSTLGDLFFQPVLTDACLKGLKKYLEKTAECNVCSAVGLPIKIAGGVYNCMAVCFGGRLLGVVPSSVSLFDGFSIPKDENLYIELFGQRVPFGRRILFSIPALDGFSFSAIFADELLSASAYPSTVALAGAGLILAPMSAPANAYGFGELCNALLAEGRRLSSAIVLADSVLGESGNDAHYFSNLLISECGSVLESGEECDSECLLFSEIDVELISAARRGLTYNDEGFLTVTVALADECTPLSRRISQTPFLPEGKAEIDAFCLRALNIQSAALARRMQGAHAKKLVLGISGGLDSSLALIVAAMCADRLELDRSSVIAISMPCFGTSNKTKSSAERLSEALGVSFRTVDISPAVSLHLKDIGHPDGVYGAAYENSQARERTQILMDVANLEGGIVVGTGDLSELALGFATYNGDHMSMYGVNASLPKTVIQRIIRYCVDNYSSLLDDAPVCGVLGDILDTPISPELLPPDAKGEISQCTESIVGPYILHDFFIYYMLKYTFSPRKILRIAMRAFGGRFSEEDIRRTLRVFITRFFASQFKRSCMPDGPSVLGISLSPRGAWRMPSDAVAETWLASLETEAEAKRKKRV